MQADRGWPDSTTDPWEQAILRDPRIAMVKENGSWFLYRPTHIVVNPETLRPTHARNRYEALRQRQALDLLNKHGATPVRGGATHGNDGPKRGPRTTADDAAVAQRLGLELWATHGRDSDLPNVVRQLRALVPDSASLNHVQVCDQHRIGGCGPADPAPAPTDVPGRSDAGSGLRIGVIDTGVDESLGLADTILGALDAEVPDSQPDQILDPAAGHGTFVTGIIRQLAPGAEVIVHRAMLGPAGVASDLEVAQAFLDMPEVDILNCSFGGASQDDAAPLVIAKALAQLSPKTVVVAAAGNQDETRPHWPGAFKGVYAVASIEQCEKTGAWERADYSNRGWWVDASAPGSDVTSTFVSFKEQAGTLRTFAGGATWSGTSFATPKVVAAIAALATSNGISASEAAYRLIDAPSVDRLPDLGALVV